MEDQRWELVLGHRGDIKFIVSRLWRARGWRIRDVTVTFEDLEQTAQLEAYKLADHYDPGLDVPFAAYIRAYLPLKLKEHMYPVRTGGVRRARPDQESVDVLKESGWDVDAGVDVASDGLVDVLLPALWSELDERERALVYEYVVEPNGRPTLGAVGLRFGVTQSRMCQIRGALRAKARVHLLGEDAA